MFTYTSCQLLSVGKRLKMLDGFLCSGKSSPPLFENSSVRSTTLPKMAYGSSSEQQQLPEKRSSCSLSSDRGLHNCMLQFDEAHIQPARSGTGRRTGGHRPRPVATDELHSSRPRCCIHQFGSSGEVKAIRSDGQNHPVLKITAALTRLVVHAARSGDAKLP